MKKAYEKRGYWAGMKVLGMLRRNGKAAVSLAGISGFYVLLAGPIRIVFHPLDDARVDLVWRPIRQP